MNTNTNRVGLGPSRERPRPLEFAAREVGLEMSGGGSLCHPPSSAGSELAMFAFRRKLAFLEIERRKNGGGERIKEMIIRPGEWPS